MEATETNSPIGWFKAISSHSISRQLIFLAGLAGSIALGVSVVLWSQADEYAPLYATLSAEDVSSVVQSLESSRTPYKLDRATGNVEVQAEQVHQIRIKLASEGLPSSEGKGFDMLYKEQELGLSSFMEKARYDRALEEELSRTIMAMESVQAARVHLAIPKPSGFIRSSGKPAASVMVNLYAGRDLADRQLAGIRNLVASSVPELSVDDVSVVDQSGRLLSYDESPDGVIGGLERFDITQKLEQSYVDRILAMITPITGIEGVRTQVKADLDFTAIETTSETYAPEAAVRSEQVAEQRSTSTLNGGIPGTLANQPPEDAVLEDEPEGDSAEAVPSNSNVSSVRNYELDKTISHVRQAPGSLNRLTVAVVLDYQEVTDEEGIVSRVPMPDEEIERIQSLVQEAIGYDEARGDRVTVTSASFLPIPELEPLPAPSILDSPLIWKVARILVAVIVCFILIFKVIKPVMKTASDAATVAAAAESQPAPPANALPAPANETGAAYGAQAAIPSMADQQDEMVSLSSQPPTAIPGAGPVYQQQLDAARTMVADEPDRVAYIVKNWVASDA